MQMEQNNIENQFREKLNSREIKPSENSWDRLDAMLTVAEQPKKNYRWMFFAASFLGFILIATVFFNQTQDAIDVPTQKVVFEKNEEGKSKDELNEILEIKPQNTETTIVASSVNSVKNNKNVIHNSHHKKNIETTPTEVAAISNHNNNISSTIIREQNSNEQINQKMKVKVNANSLLASVDNGTSSQAVASNIEVIKVNSNSLLSQVDEELELSFRERVIQSVNKKYREVKVAVVKRNLD